MILCAALLFCVLATAALVLWAVWEHEQAQGLEAIAEHQEMLRALGGDR